MAFNHQHGSLTRIPSAPAATQDLNFPLSYCSQFFTGPSVPFNARNLPNQNSSVPASGLVLDNINAFYPNSPWMMPPQGMTQPVQIGPVTRNTGTTLPSTQSSDLGEHQLKRKLTTMLQSEQMELFESNAGDCRVICGDRIWKVHGYILAPRCDFFAAALDWKRDQEEKCINIDMNGDDSEAIDILLRYLYTRNSELLSHNISTNDQRPQLLAKIAIVADKYGQADLIAQVRIELMKWAQHAKQLSGSENAEAARAALLALIKLRAHDSRIEPLLQLHRLLLRFLRDSRQLQIMDATTTTLLKKAIRADLTLAIALLQFCSGCSRCSSCPFAVPPG